VLTCVAVCCTHSRVRRCCSVLHCVEACYNVLRPQPCALRRRRKYVLQCVAVCCSELQCVAVA